METKISLENNTDGTVSLIQDEGGKRTELVHILDTEEAQDGMFCLGDLITDYYKDKNFYTAMKLQRDKETTPTVDALMRWRKSLYQRRLARLRIFLQNPVKSVLAHACMLMLESIYGSHDLAIADWLRCRISREDWEMETKH